MLLRRRPLVALAAIAVAWGVGCAPRQQVALHVEPAGSRLFVDGEDRGPTPEVIELRADVDHKLYFKSEGHRPTLVVLESRAGEDAPRLEPARVDVVLEPLSAQGREVRIEGVE